MRRFFYSLVLALVALSVRAGDAPTLYPLTSTTSALAPDSRFFELRTYHIAPGKADALHARFRDATSKLFTKHGMTMIGYWVPMNKEGQYENTLVYLLAFPSREAHDKSWKEFAADPDWKTAKEDSEKNGKLVEKVDSVYLTATDYSPLK